MVRFFRASHRRGQWERSLGYSKLLQRASPRICLVTTLALLAALYCARRFVVGLGQQHTDSHLSRRLLATTANQTFYDYKCDRLNASLKGHLTWESCDFEKATNAPGGWIALYIFLTIIIFVALAIVCDDFFVPSLEAISEKLSLSEDVAGATFMAAGSSAPELFSSIAAVTFDSDAGVGTIAGSAVFNLLVIISLTAAFAGQVLQLDWRPLTRDAVYYLISICVFIFVVSDSKIEIWEAALLLSLYVIYIIIMVLNVRLMACLDRTAKACTCSKCCEATSVEPQGEDEEAPKANGILQENNRDRRPSVLSIISGDETKRQFKHDRRNSVMLNLHNSQSSLRDKSQPLQPMPDRKASDSGVKKASIKPHAIVIQYSEFEETQDTALKEDLSSKEGASSEQGDEEKPEGEEEEDEARIKCCCSCCPDIRGAPPQKHEEMTPLRWFLFVLKWIIFVLAFPFLIAFSYTIPECSKEHLKKWFLVSFIVSVLWIAALSFAMVTIVARTGCLMGIDTFVMSLVVLAAGTSIPDLLSSIIVARDGFGDMAVSNAIGSNVFDIDLGLGLPFLIRIAVKEAVPLDMLSDDERRAFCEGTMLLHPHVKFGGILIGLLVIAMVVIIISRFRLGKVIGVSFFVLYVAFLVYAFCQEFLCNQKGTYNC